MPQRLDESAKGVFVIAPTPFREDGALDEASAERMTDAFLATGASGLTILGVMGEAPKLDAEEARRFVSLVLRPLSLAMPGSGLDPSWIAVLGEAAVRHARWGVDLAFTYGPASALVTRYFTDGYLASALPFLIGVAEQKTSKG